MKKIQKSLLEGDKCKNDDLSGGAANTRRYQDTTATIKEPSSRDKKETY